MKTFRIATLGCKVNQCESAAIAGTLKKAGYQTGPQDRPADICIVNTCTVTGKASMQSRQVIRQAIRANPGAKIIVTGCYAQTAPEDIRAIERVDLIVAHDDKLKLVDILQAMPRNDWQPMAPASSAPPLSTAFSPLPDETETSRTRAFLKIQDGCNAFCTYCIVPYARGRSRSMPVSDVQHHLDRLDHDGYREVVLTGIHLGAFGADLEPATSLAALLNGLRPMENLTRLRLSSIEPTEFSPALIERIISHNGHLDICPHLHIPLQSGDDGILKQMHRPYTRRFFSDLIMDLHARMPNAAIGADVLVGFPGEDDAAFEQTRCLIESLPLTYLHVFPYSPRQGTPAARMSGRTPEHVLKNRCRLLRHLGNEKKGAFFRSQIGQRLDVLVESKKDAATGMAKGLSANYLPVEITDGKPAINTIVTVSIDRVSPELKVFGHIIASGADHAR